jgi:hypothetical protein
MAPSIRKSWQSLQTYLSYFNETKIPLHVPQTISEKPHIKQVHAIHRETSNSPPLMKCKGKGMFWREQLRKLPSSSTSIPVMAH